MKLSVVLATYNEEENLGRCLDSIKTIADEIIVVDGQSSDKTVDIAKKHKAKVTITTNKPIFHINKQIGLDKAKGKWVLQLDADEVVSKELADEIKETINFSGEELLQKKLSRKKTKLFKKHQELIEKRDGSFSDKTKSVTAFFIPRSNYFLGRNMKYTGVYPDGVIRLVKNGKAKFPCKSVHEQIQIDGKVSWLGSDLIHYDSPTFEKYIKRANRYTSLTATKLREEKVGINLKNHIYYLFIKPISVFLKLFIRHKGFLDRFPGFVFSLFSGIHFSLAYMKYWETKKQ
ncbi:glycosyltransferase family 2 protein [Patescibacteria group bacterium]